MCRCPCSASPPSARDAGAHEVATARLVVLPAHLPGRRGHGSLLRWEDANYSWPQETRRPGPGRQLQARCSTVVRMRWTTLMRLGRLGPAAAATAFLPPIGSLILLGTMNQSAPWLQSHGAAGRDVVRRGVLGLRRVRAAAHLRAVGAGRLGVWHGRGPGGDAGGLCRRGGDWLCHRAPPVGRSVAAGAGRVSARPGAPPRAAGRLVARGRCWW